MSVKKLLYNTPEVRIEELEVFESFLASSAGASLKDVDEEEVDFIY